MSPLTITTDWEMEETALIVQETAATVLVIVFNNKKFNCKLGPGHFVKPE